MPTDARSRQRRYLVTGHFRQGLGYRVDRPEGCHDWLLIYTLAGSGRVETRTLANSGATAAVSGSLKAHSVALIPPHVPHCYMTCTGDRRGSGRGVGDRGNGAGTAAKSESATWAFLWAHFLPLPQWLPWLNWPRLEDGLEHESSGSRFREAGVMAFTMPPGDARRQAVASLRQAHALTQGYRRHGEVMAITALESALQWIDEANPLADTAAEAVDPRVRTAMDLLCRRLNERLTVEDLADACCLSASRLAHLFREQVGQSPMRFLEAQRIRRARELLEHSALGVAEISDRVGFESPFYFSRRFSLAVGMSPRAYRATVARE